MQVAPEAFVGWLEGANLGKLGHITQQCVARLTFHVFEEDVLLASIAMKCFHVR
jgi:hypothetical protein